MKIGIVGLGLIGGSLALELTRQGFYTVGVSRQEKTCCLALEKSIVCESGVDLQLLGKCNLIIICTPIKFILSTIENIIPYLPPETIITDVGSVKGAIALPARELWKNFVGSHPMAGNANQGIEFAESGLFNNAPCVITPVENTPSEAIKNVREIWQRVGCRIYQTTPELHDQAVAWISHLPVMISANLISSCMEEEEQVRSFAQNLASSGFRDTSRVGGGNPELGLMMAQYNRQQLLTSLKKYQQNLDLLIDKIENNNWEELAQILRETHRDRNKFL